MKKFLYLLLGLLSVVALSAAGSKSGGSAAASGVPAEAPAMSSSSADYVLSPSDLIEVQVYGEETLLRDVRISRDYTIVLPLIGQIDLSGKTLRQAEDIIREKYGADYLVNPQINLMVKEYSKRTVTVLGEVAHQGPVLFPLEQGMTLTDAIGAAGGFTPLAKLSNVQITRTLPDGSKQTFIKDVTKLIANQDKKSQEQDFPLVVNDIINVDQIFFIK